MAWATTAWLEVSGGARAGEAVAIVALAIVGRAGQVGWATWATEVGGVATTAGGKAVGGTRSADPGRRGGG